MDRLVLCVFFGIFLGLVAGSASGANERLHSLHRTVSGDLSPCADDGGGYTAGTGLTLSCPMFSVAPTDRLPQGCSTGQIPQWNGTAWACARADSGTLPVGAENKTLRYNGSGALVPNDFVQAFVDGGLLAGGMVGSGTIPVSGVGTRMMWYPAKAAFRAGGVNTAAWDDTNVGDYSNAIGQNPIASGSVAVSMGLGTVASGNSSVALGNRTNAVGDQSMAMGGSTTASGNYSVAMGRETSATADSSTAIGNGTKATGAASIAMGYYTLASGQDSTAMGNNTTASAIYSTAMGQSTIANGDYSIAMGRNVSSGGFQGAFIYGDATGRARISNSANNQFKVVASGGIQFYSDPAIGAELVAGSGAWTVISDRNAKTAVQPVDGRDVLKKVVALPMNTWQYKTQDEKYRHMGPMAQDFYAAFRLGESSKGIDTVDADGVALAAIQGLNALRVENDAKIAARLDEKDHEIAVLRSEKDREIAALRVELTAQKLRVSALESLAGDLADLKAQLTALRQSSAQPVAVAALRRP